MGARNFHRHCHFPMRRNTYFMKISKKRGSIRETWAPTSAEEIAVKHKGVCPMKISGVGRKGQQTISRYSQQRTKYRNDPVTIAANEDATREHKHRTQAAHCLHRVHCNRDMMTSSMETFSALLAICVGNSPVPGEFPTQRPVTRSFDVYFDLRPNKRLSKQSWGWWFDTPSRPLWRHRNDLVAIAGAIIL